MIKSYDKDRVGRALKEEFSRSSDSGDELASFDTDHRRNAEALEELLARAGYKIEKDT